MNPYLNIAWITICLTASLFIAGNEAIILYFHFFKGFPHTFTGLVIADVLLMLAGTIAFIISCRSWYRYHQMIKRVKESLNKN